MFFESLKSKSTQMLGPQNGNSGVSFYDTPEFPFRGLDICIDFDLRDSKKMENINKVKKKIFYYKNIDIHKTA